MEGIDYRGESSYTRGINKGILRNNISYNGSVRNCDGAGIDASNNSWDMSGLSVSNADFLSVDTAGVFGPRKADGSLPDVKFMRLSADSKLIDKGKDVGLPFTGSAPDLGAFEYQDPSIVINVASSQKALLPATGASGAFDLTKSVVYDFLGRRISSGMLDNQSLSLLYIIRPPAGLCHSSTCLHLR